MERIRGRPRLTGMGENEHHSGERTRREARPRLSGQPSLAACGNGLFRAADAAGRTALARAVASGTAIRLAAGICVDAETWDEAHWPERRRLRCLAQATANPELVLTGISAARVHRLQLLRDPDADTGEPVHMGRTARGRTTTTAGRVIRAFHGDHRDITVVDGVRCATIALTVHDVRGTHGPIEALTVADDALLRGHSRGCLAEPLGRLFERRADGARETATVFALASALSDSPAESWTKWLIHRAGLRTALQQVYVVGPDGAPIRRVDFWIPELAMAIEFHGAVKYSGDYGDPDVLSTRENRQIRDLLNCGVDVIQLTWAMLADGRAARIIAQRAHQRRELLQKAGPQFTGETYLRHERMPQRVTRHFNR